MLVIVLERYLTAAKIWWWKRSLDYMGTIDLMRMGRLQSQRLGLACMWLLAFGGVMTSLNAKPRQAVPPFPEQILYYQRFENLVTNREGNVAVSELATNAIFLKNCDLLESWSGYSVGLAGNKVAFCYVPSLTGPKKNFSPVEGAIRFYFSPNYSTGKGPGDRARLLEISEVSEHPNAGWALHVNPEGSRLSLTAYAAGESEDLITVPIDWTAGAWMQIGVVYSASNDFTGLIINGQMVATGKGMGPLDRLVSLEKWGLFLGGAVNGKHLAEGQFDELTAFQQYLRESDYAWNYSCMAPIAALGPITLEEETARRLLVAQKKTSLSLATASMNLEVPMQMMELIGDEFALSSPVLNGTNFILTIIGANTNKSYDIYHLAVLTNSWTNAAIAALGSQGQTNFSNVIIPTPIGFYRAAEGKDWDGDTVFNYMDAQPFNAAVSNLILVIQTPTNNGTIQ